jgi:hypothetical protein
MKETLKVSLVKCRHVWRESFANLYERRSRKPLGSKESRTLASLRDGLLPKLMRGEVRVKEV